MEARNSQEKHERILSLFFNTTGFAYVLMDGPVEIKCKGIKPFKPASNHKIWETLISLIKDMEPDRVILENPAGEKSRKGSRITKLIKKLKPFLEGMKMPYDMYDRDQIRVVFDLWHARSKYEIALVIAQNIPAFKDLIYPKPKYPKFEHYRTVLFDAVALGITHYYITT